MNKTKKAIFNAAIKVFSIEGYDSATVEEIASEAGVAKGTLYYNFQGKEEIFKFVIDEGMKLIKNEVLDAIKDKERLYESELIFLPHFLHSRQQRQYFQSSKRTLYQSACYQQVDPEA